MDSRSDNALKALESLGAALVSKEQPEVSEGWFCAKDTGIAESTFGRHARDAVKSGKWERKRFNIDGKLTYFYREPRKATNQRK